MKQIIKSRLFVKKTHSISIVKRTPKSHKTLFEEEISHILPLIINEAHQYKALTDFIKPYDLYNISAIRKPLIESIESFFPDFEIKTHLSNLFSLISEINNEKNTILIFVENMHFTALALQNHQFIGANGFHLAMNRIFRYYNRLISFVKFIKQKRNIQL